MPGNAAGDDPIIMREIRFDIDRDAVKRHPTPHAHAYSGDLVLGRTSIRERRLVRTADPDPDPALAALSPNLEIRKRRHHPALQRGDIAAQIPPARGQVQHDIGDALARPVIGPAPASSRLEDRETPLDQLAPLRAPAM